MSIFWGYLGSYPTETPLQIKNFMMDLIMDLPTVDGVDSILVVVDQGLLKGVILSPCTKTLITEGAAQLLLNNLYKRYGLPDRIISDQGLQFAA